MTDNLTPDARRQDDELAEFTDQLLKADVPEILEMAAQERELAELQNTLVRLKRAFGSGQPDEAMAGRIRANLAKEWHEAGPGARASAASPRSLGLHRLARRQAYAFYLLAAILVVGVLFLLLSPDTSTGGALPGAARSQSGLLPVAFVLGFGLAGGLWWFFRQRRSR